ncbi:MAG: hypothetical protein HYV26_23360 [Candidatus Hydrogenedentes bacterium]|nr:hypothetical protein [Candidatus Hydrogenedentota bacterium]MBI3119056.1 hypothetical protein [Candidatus Hydrogenedentota bacterium]
MKARKQPKEPTLYLYEEAITHSRGSPRDPEPHSIEVPGEAEHSIAGTTPEASKKLEVVTDLVPLLIAVLVLLVFVLGSIWW